MVIITAATVVLVLVSASFALQVLERQRASAEFDIMIKSILAFDDAVRDIAWDRNGSRSVRFTTNYGSLALLPNNKSLSISVDEYPVSYSLSTGVVRYSIPSTYVTFGNEYESFILGNENAVVSSVTDSYGQVLAKQQFGVLSLTLNYRVRVMQQGPFALANYVDILVIRLNCTSLRYLTGDFDLVARNVGIATNSSNPFPADGSRATVSVSLDGFTTNSISVDLDPALPVIFNLIVADVKVSN
jgi:hypothetical protein